MTFWNVWHCSCPRDQLMSGRGPADFSLRITAVDEGMKPREMWPWKRPLNHSEVWSCTFQRQWQVSMGAVVVELLTITANNTARFSFGILFWWIVQYVQGRNRHAGFNGWWVVLAVNHLWLVPSLPCWTELLFSVCLGGPTLHAFYHLPVASVMIRSGVVVIPSMWTPA